MQIIALYGCSSDLVQGVVCLLELSHSLFHNEDDGRALEFVSFIQYTKLMDLIHQVMSISDGIMRASLLWGQFTSELLWILVDELVQLVLIELSRSVKMCSL